MNLTLYFIVLLVSAVFIIVQVIKNHRREQSQIYEIERYSTGIVKSIEDISNIEQRFDTFDTEYKSLAREDIKIKGKELVVKSFSDVDVVMCNLRIYQALKIKEQELSIESLCFSKPDYMQIHLSDELLISKNVSYNPQVKKVKRFINSDDYLIAM